MKKWTLVFEFSTTDEMTQGQLQAEASLAFSKHFGDNDSIRWFQNMETIEAPYGPQGVTVQCSTWK